MKILSIETSCDETALSIIEASGSVKKPSFEILANKVASQIKIHAEFGGVFPMMAKREHAKNTIPILKEILQESGLEKKSAKGNLSESYRKKIDLLLEREPEMREKFFEYIPKIQKPKIDLIAVTSGPGLEPALWVGINFAKALSIAWGIPVIPVNHMEGHVVSSIIKSKKMSQSKTKAKKEIINPVSFPAISLLISGGHTELVLIKDWMKYKIIGETLDDAAGEAFDKVARMLGLSYPGGPEISKLAKSGKKNPEIKLPRPMIHTSDFKFSFSGLKTAVLYLGKNLAEKYKVSEAGNLPRDIKADIALEFELAVTDVLVQKTMRAVEKYKAKTLLLGGGVAGNERIKKTFEETATERFSKLNLYFPRKDLSTDNSLMIAIAGYFRFLRKKKGATLSSIKAEGNLKIK